MLGKKTAEDTLQTAKLLMDHGLRDLINEADSLGNTPLHVLIARYALEERKLAHSNSKSYGYHDDHQVQLIQAFIISNCRELYIILVQCVIFHLFYYLIFTTALE